MQEHLSKLLIVSILFVATASMVMASLADGFTLDMLCVERNAANYNSNIDNAPFLLTSFLGSEKINLNVVRDNWTLFRAGLDMVDGRIEHIAPGGYNESTIAINTSERAMNEVILSRDKISTFKNLTDEGRIDFHAEGWQSQAKLKIILSSASVLQFGYDLFFG
ncbi:MAG: hypothetical protein MUE87_04380 [Methanothrix sp.]|jgi:hypothetical protein|nr:hypothetical protein [Methanothrix sp.]